jgi:hypothetical protein
MLEMAMADIGKERTSGKDEGDTARAAPGANA